nr:hypothetical protein [Tianweitania sediminis]
MELRDDLDLRGSWFSGLVGFLLGLLGGVGSLLATPLFIYVLG